MTSEIGVSDLHRCHFQTATRQASYPGSAFRSSSSHGQSRRTYSLTLWI